MIGVETNIWYSVHKSFQLFQYQNHYSVSALPKPEVEQMFQPAQSTWHTGEFVVTHTEHFQLVQITYCCWQTAQFVVIQIQLLQLNQIPDDSLELGNIPCSIILFCCTISIKFMLNYCTINGNHKNVVCVSH